MNRKVCLLKTCKNALLLLAMTSVGLALFSDRISAEQPTRAYDRLLPSAFAIYPEENLGVRVENTVLITETGCENLTPGIPREIDEIEKLMSGAAKAP